MSDAPPPLSVSPDAQGTTAKAGQSIDEGKGRTFPCEGCGADLKFHIGQQQLKCPYCGFEKEIKELLGIPDNVDTAALLPLGYPAEGVRYGPTRRRPVEEVTYGEKWGRPWEAKD